MKKITCLMLALAVCLSIAAPVFATENEGFVPSITYKPSPEIVPAKNEEGKEFIGVIRNEKGEIIDYVEHGCLNITPIAHIWDEKKEVSKEVEKLLTFVYEELTTNKMEIPYDKHNANLEASKMVIRDLFDARWNCDEHRIMIEEKGVCFEITFDLGVAADTPIYVMTYDEDAKEWNPIVNTVNNGDGTVTCTFEHLCAIEFSMSVGAANAPIDDTTAMTIWPWIVILVIAAAAIVVIIISKKSKKESAV